MVVEIFKIIFIGFITLFLSYKIGLFLADSKKREAKKFFKSQQTEKRECEKELEDILCDQFTKKRSLLKRSIYEHILPAFMALALVGGVGLSLIVTEEKKPQKSTSVTITHPSIRKLPVEIKQLQPDILLGQKQEEIYSWIDKNGVPHFVNTQPASPNTKSRLITNKRETPVFIANNQILVPVIIGHNGKAVRTYFLLDTGCTTTLLHNEVTDAIRPEVIGRGESTVADGRKIKSNLCMVDFIQVGPFTEYNFKTTAYDVKGQENFRGLLGMNFLKKHPFQIISERNVIIWL